MNALSYIYKDIPKKNKPYFWLAAALLLCFFLYDHLKNGDFDDDKKKVNMIYSDSTFLNPFNYPKNFVPNEYYPPVESDPTTVFTTDSRGRPILIENGNGFPVTHSAILDSFMSQDDSSHLLKIFRLK